MALTKPIVYVYQEQATTTATPGVPDLNCCVVGPAYYIQDYATDKDDIEVGEFVKSGETKDADCGATGTSDGRPDPSADFLVLSEPPNIAGAPGAILDSTSVEVYFDEALIELAIGADGAVTGTDDNEFTSVVGDFVNDGVAPGDRLVMTNTSGTGTVVKLVKTVDAAGTLSLTTTFKTAEVATIGSSSIRYRVEHQLDDQAIGSTYFAVSGQEITIMTGPTGVLLAYNGTSYSVNYAATMHVEYTALRQDLNALSTITSTSAITTTVGRIDERNPLAVGVFVAMQNTSTPIQALGLDTDDAAGHSTAMDTLSTRDDVYAIVPVTGALTGSSWTSIINSWKGHCETYSEFDKAKFRIVLGSYDDLPTEKSSAPAATDGNTETYSDETEVTVFVDPESLTDFRNDNITSDHLLDVTKTSTADLNTCDQYKHMFSASGYDGAHALLGVMGGKRLRTTVASAFASAQSEACSYFVRAAITKAEGVSTGSIYADSTGCTWGADGGTKGRITKTGAFANVAIGDIAHVSGGTTAEHNDGFYVIAVDASDNYIDVEIAEQTADTVDVQVYRPVAGTNLGSITASSRTITDAGTNDDFTNVGIGDIAIVLQSPGDVPGDGNIGMMVVENKTDNNNIIVGDPDSTLIDDTAGTNVVFFRSVSANPDVTVTTRPRLKLLRDNDATFTTSVEVAEDIEIPYPADTDPTKWDTTTTQWPIGTILDDNRLLATLTDLQELAPEEFTAGFSSNDMPYRINIDLDRTAQVTELNTITSSLQSQRCVMVWPNSCKVNGVENEKTSTQNWVHGQYLACAVGGMVAGLPSHQGFTYIGISGIELIRNSNNYFTDTQLEDLHDGGWYIFAQDSEASVPYTIHEVTTDLTSYETGELMNVKNFDFVAMFYRDLMQVFLGRYNITPETLSLLRSAFDTGTETLRLRLYPRLGAPILSADVTLLEQSSTEVDRVEIYAEVDLPKVLNKIGLHLLA